MTYHLQKGRGYGHVTVLKFCRCRDVARRADSSATTELVVRDALPLVKASRWVQRLRVFSCWF